MPVILVPCRLSELPFACEPGSLRRGLAGRAGSSWRAWGWGLRSIVLGRARVARVARVGAIRPSGLLGRVLGVVAVVLRRVSSWGRASTEVRVLRRVLRVEAGVGDVG